MVVGDGGVGKTALLLAYALGYAPVDYVPTVFDNFSKRVVVDGRLVDLALWDTAGMEDYDRLRPLSYPETQVFLLCFSLDNRDSLENCRQKWMPELRHFLPDVPVILVGNKFDVRVESSSLHSVIPWQDGHRMAREMGCVAYYETSAITQASLQLVFTNAVRAALGNKHRTTPIPNCLPWKSGTSRRHQSDIMNSKLVHQRPSPPLPPKVDPDCYIDVEPSTYVSDLRHMLNNPLCADVEFHVEFVVFHAHRIVLCASSLLFKQMFNGDEVPIVDNCDADGQPLMAVSQRCKVGQDVHVVSCSRKVKATAFVRLLEYIYTGYPLLEGVSVEMLDDVESLGQLFNIPQLVRHCRYIRSGNLARALKTTMAVRERFCEAIGNQFLNHTALADTWFNVNGVTVPAHAALLVARSDVMAAMLADNAFSEGMTRQVIIQDSSVQGFLALLEYLYTDTVQFDGETDLVELLVLADRFCLPRLVALCELHITREVESVMKCGDDFDLIGLLLTAEFYNAVQLRIWCLDVIASKYEMFSVRPKFELLQGENLVYVNEHKWPPLSYLEEEEEYRKITDPGHSQQDKKGKCTIM